MIKPIALTAILCLLCCRQALPQSIGLNNDNSPPHASALLDVASTTKGFLPPRMTLAQRNAIKDPATGLLVYQTNNNPGFYVFKDAWVQLSDQWQSNGFNSYNRYSGNVGIGTSTPPYKLTIRTGLKQYGFVHTDGDGIVGSWIGDFQGSGYGGWLGTLSNHPLHFYTAGGAAQLTLQSNGNVGIGTASPSFKLDVAGRIRLRSETKSGAAAGLWFNDRTNTNAIAFVGVPQQDNAIGLYGSVAGWGIIMNTISGNVGIAKNPGSANFSDASLQVRGRKINGTEMATLTLESPSGVYNWSFLIPDYIQKGHSLELYRNNLYMGMFASGDGSYHGVSDIRLKENLQPYPEVLSNVMLLKPYRYHFKNNPDTSASIGFIAQQVASVFPELVKAGCYRNNDSLLSLNYQALSVIALKAIQEQQVMIDELKATIVKIKQEMELLKQRL
ncbi:tail fiber domain-containing protein [Foetidibacter luteolus]|uniref:tail fiber domain-containing protein n=1 Tax=Foetidibacter luteolus TaxID=2608880 RepID=UPI00129ADAAD|nr:tail fiber domain-containing protein [Foetidibacter luteolus]